MTMHSNGRSTNSAYAKVLTQVYQQLQVVSPEYMDIVSVFLILTVGGLFVTCAAPNIFVSSVLPEITRYTNLDFDYVIEIFPQMFFKYLSPSCFPSVSITHNQMSRSVQAD